MLPSPVGAHAKKMWRQEVVSNFNYCRFSSQIACVFALLGSLLAGLNFAFDFSFISVWKWLCICIFFFTTLEVKRWHSEIRQLPKYLFFIWIWVASAPRTSWTSWQFSLVTGVTGAYEDLCTNRWACELVLKRSRGMATLEVETTPRTSHWWYLQTKRYQHTKREGRGGARFCKDWLPWAVN